MSETKFDKDGWCHDLDQCPWQQTVEVTNNVMEHPVLATRGRMTETGMSENSHLFTTRYTRHDKWTSTPAGLLACPTKWRPLAAATGGEK